MRGGPRTSHPPLLSESKCSLFGRGPAASSAPQRFAHKVGGVFGSGASNA
jgi:hypothetical protein